MAAGVHKGLTVPAVKAWKARGGTPPLVMVTAYDAPGARIVDEAGVDIILVGDSLAMVVLGHPNTLQVGMAEMLHHTAAVARARPRALLVADMPWLSYHLGAADAVANAAALVRAGADAVKLEGGARRLPVIEALLGAEVQVMGHIGLTPQSVHAMGGFKVQASDKLAAEQLVQDAVALADAGCFAIVLEGVPDVVAQVVTGEVSIPTIGIGAGPYCDGQVLVLHDLLGLTPGVPGEEGARSPRFVRRYAQMAQAAAAAVGDYARDVRERRFPAGTESYHGGADIKAWAARRSSA